MATTSSWRCLVCGYVHHGPEPPEECPICGAPAGDFEAYEEPQSESAEKPEVNQWECVVCGYIHDGPEPPEECPVCGAGQDSFEPVQSKSEKEKVPAGEEWTCLIAGAGIAGLSAAQSTRQAAPNARVILLSKENTLPYYRLNLTRYLAGEIEDADLPMHPAEWYEEQRIDLRPGVSLEAIDRNEKKARLSTGDALAYDKLILATGAHPFVPPIDGAQKKGVHTIRTDQDARKVRGMDFKKMRCAIIGGGILGLETAGALARQGAQVTLLEGYGWLLPRQLNEQAGKVLGEKVRQKGIDLQTGKTTQAIQGDKKAESILFEDGSTLPADLILITTGVRPNSYLAREAGLQVNKGVVVNDVMQTSDEAIYAAGDLAEHKGVLYGIWAPSQFQGDIAGRNASGQNVQFGGVPRSNTLKVLGVDLFSIGRVQADDGSDRELTQEKDGHYLRFLIRDGRLEGAILLGDTALTSFVKKAMDNNHDFTEALREKGSAEGMIQALKQV